MEHNCINTAKIATLENEVSNIKEQIIEFKDVGMAVVELSTIQKQNQIRDAERDKERKEQSKLLQQQTLTLSKINDNLDLMKNEINDIKNETNARIDKLENKFNQSESKSTIDIRDLIKNAILKFIIPIGGTLTILYEIFKNIFVK